MSENFINMYCLYSHSDGYVIWKDDYNKVGSEFRKIDIRDASEYIKLRFFSKKEIRDTFKTFRLQTTDLKVRVLKTAIITIDITELDSY